MRILLTICLLCMFQPSVHAEGILSAKLGVVTATMKNASNSVYEELSYELRNKYLGVEFALGHYNLTLKGEEVIELNDGGMPKEWGNNKVRGRLIVFPCSVIAKGYFKRCYAGAGVGWQFISFKQRYEGNTSVKDEPFYTLLLGYDIAKKLSIEAKYVVSDLTIESGNRGVGVAEDKSNLHALLILARYRF